MPGVTLRRRPFIPVVGSYWVERPLKDIFKNERILMGCLGPQITS